MANSEWIEEHDEGDDVITKMQIDDYVVTAVATPAEAMSDKELAYEVINLPGGKSAIVAVNKKYISYMMGNASRNPDDEESEDDFRERCTKGAYSFGVTIGQVLTMTCIELREGLL